MNDKNNQMFINILRIGQDDIKIIYNLSAKIINYNVVYRNRDAKIEE